MSYNDLLDILMLEKPSVVLITKKDELATLIPEFAKTYNFDQRNDWHIYSVFAHILKVVDETPAILPLRIASLFHDVGKPYTFKLDKKGIGHFHHHAEVSELIFAKHAENFELKSNDIFLIKKLIWFHDIKLPTDDYSVSEIIDNFDGSIELLFFLKEADILAYNPKYHSICLKELYELKNIYLKSKKLIK